MARLQAGHAGGQERAELEQTGQVQADQGEQRRQRRHHAGALQLEAPAQAFAGGAQGQQQRTQRGEGQNHAGGVGQAAEAVGAPVIGVAGEADHLDGQHREHAGHQVQDQATEQRTQQHQHQRRGAACGGRGGCGGVGLEGGVGCARYAGAGGDLGPFAHNLELGAPALSVGGQHHRHQGRTVQPLRRQRDARGPFGAIPGLLGRGRGLDDFGRFREDVQRLAAQLHRQALHTEAQQVAVDPDHAVGQDALGGQRWPGLGLESGLKRRPVERGGALEGDLEGKFAFFRNALLATHQPGRLELDVQRVARQRRFEVGCDRQRHRQQHRALVAVVGQAANRDLLRDRPGNVAGDHARRQRPFERGRQAGVAGILPVGVPLGLVRELQPDPDRLLGRCRFAESHRNALRCERQQLGAHLRRRDDGFGRILSPSQRRMDPSCYQNQSRKENARQTESNHG